MKHFQLIRQYNPFGVFGELRCDELGFSCLTLERPWKDNEPFVSCIPPGTYICRRFDSPEYGDTFIVTDVSGRTLILFHEGNWIKNSKGCILLGKEYDLSAREGLMVTSSLATRKKFMAALEGIDEFELTITTYQPEYP